MKNVIKIEIQCGLVVLGLMLIIGSWLSWMMHSSNQEWGHMWILWGPGSLFMPFWAIWCLRKESENKACNSYSPMRCNTCGHWDSNDNICMAYYLNSHKCRDEGYNNWQAKD